MRLPMASMLEGFVSQLLADYLSNYVEGIQPEQFRLGIWNGVAELENVRLRLEAFDYLQLPFAIKKGIVGKLKLQVPWKKLGWEPILVVLEDVFICACPRDEFEWKSEALETRSLAAKRAKLAAAELAKLSARMSRRVSDDNPSQSFLSHLSTKIIDNVQVTAQNVHFRYIDQKTDPEVAFSFGIALSSFTVNTDHTQLGNSTGRTRINQVNKLVEIKELAVYWNSNEKDIENFTSCIFTGLLAESSRKYLVRPFDISLRFVVNKNSLFDASTPQYSVVLDTNVLAFTLEDRQLHEMLLLWDALSICKMREKYGRFRPAVGQHGYNRRENGWQKVWWCYTVQAVLVDVRRNLRRTSWSYLGWRMEIRRKYVTLYELKLGCLRKGKPAADQNLCELEELEKTLDVDEILSFRSIAENHLQGQQGESQSIAEDSLNDNIDTSFKESVHEGKLDDQSSQKQRSWLNFLSLGMLGAAGSTKASGQFAGVLPDDLIEDIYEAMKYHPIGSKDHGDLPNGYCRVAVTSCIDRLSITLRGLCPKEDIGSMSIKGIEARLNVWQQSTTVLVSINELEAADLCEKNSIFPVILGNQGSILPVFSEQEHPQPSYAEAASERKQQQEHPVDLLSVSDACAHSAKSFGGPLIVVEIELLSDDKDFDMIIKIRTQPLEFVYSPKLMKRMSVFISRPASLQTLKELIFSSLNRLQTPHIRMQSKADLVLAMRKRIGLQIQIQRPVMIFPQSLQNQDCTHLVIVSHSLEITSLQWPGNSFPEGQSGKLQWPHLSNVDGAGFGASLSSVKHAGVVESYKHWFEERLYPALYNEFRLDLYHVEVILASHGKTWQESWKDPITARKLRLAECFDAEAVFGVCALPDEPSLTRFKVHANLPALEVLMCSKKWKAFKSFFADDPNPKSSSMYDDPGMNAICTANNGIISSGADELEGTNKGSSSFLTSHGVANLDVSIESRTFLLNLQPSEETGNIFAYDNSILLGKGEAAAFRFMHYDFQQELQFVVNNVHIKKASPLVNGSTFLSLHSASRLSVTASFMPITIWKWNWSASQIAIIARGVSDAEQVIVANVQDMECIGLTKNNCIEHMKFRVLQLSMHTIECQSGNPYGALESVLSSSIHSCITCTLRQQLCKEILVCAPAVDNQPGLEICVSCGTGTDKHLFVSIPCLKVFLHLTAWAKALTVLAACIENFVAPVRADQKTSPPGTPDRLLEAQCLNEGESSSVAPPEMTANSLESTILLQSSLMSISFIIPNFDWASVRMHTCGIQKHLICNRCLEKISELELDSDQIQKYIFLNLTLQVENLVYRKSTHTCDLEASILKSGVDLKEGHSDASQCLPLLQIADVQTKTSIDLKKTPKIYVTASIVVKRIDIWCSYAILCFLKAFSFEQLNSSASKSDIEANIGATLQRSSILLTDGRWSCNAPIFELRMKNMDTQTSWRPDSLDLSSSLELEADYHNMEKVTWEPLLEPWSVSFSISSTLASFSRILCTNLRISSYSELNVNITKPLLQATSRAVDLCHDACTKRKNLRLDSGSNHSASAGNKISVGYAPYWFQNDTGVSITYWLVGSRLENDDGSSEGRHLSRSAHDIVQPGCSIPLRIEETPEQVFRKGRVNSSSERLVDKRSFGGQHRMICVQLEGTSKASSPMSIDLVGCRFFSVTFCHSSSGVDDIKRRTETQNLEGKHIESSESDAKSNAFCTPVVFDVSVQHYSKIIRIYSTVSLVNATCIPMEVRFDIPFGILPKVMEPILPGQVMPLPVHLAETGQIRWKPLGNSHLWSEPQSLSNILLPPSRPVSLRSFVSSPVHLSNAPFRCCIIVGESLAPSTFSTSAVPEEMRNSLQANWKHTASDSQARMYYSRSPVDESSAGILREVTFQAPFVFRNCLPLPVSLTIESGAGLNLSLSAPEGDSIFVFEVNSAHDLTLNINVPGFLPALTKLASASAPLDLRTDPQEDQVLSVETLELLPKHSGGSVVDLKVQKLFNWVCGTRELSIYVPIWFYNYSGVDLGLVDGDTDPLSGKGKPIREQVIASHPGIQRDDRTFVPEAFGLQTVSQVPRRDFVNIYSGGQVCANKGISLLGGKKIISYVPKRSNSMKDEVSTLELINPNAHIYSPSKEEELGDKRLRVRIALPLSRDSLLNVGANETRWSRPFAVNPPGGMTTVVIPDLKGEGALLLSVVSTSVLGACAGKTRSITFRPRFVLANTCSQDLCYKQQGTDNFNYLLKGEQAHLHWSDTSRLLLVSIRFEQHGWDWSGGFVADQLGDTQLKVRNFVTGATQMLRVEVQNASSLDSDVDGITSTDNSLGTYLVLLSDDESGFMPYRIDNFSLERLRFYQVKCPKFESILLPYSSCSYAWDEPWRPHQLVLEIPGEGCVGTYDLDEVKEYTHAQLPATHQKLERRFSMSVHAEGPIRVLTFQDMNMHPKKDACALPEKGLRYSEEEQDHDMPCTVEFNLVLSFLGISVIDSSPQEILFGCARGVTLRFLQGPHQQKLNMSISYFQLDNQLRHAQYPVMLSVGMLYASTGFGAEQNQGVLERVQDQGGALFEFSSGTALSLGVAKWRHLASSVDCFQYISVRIAQVQLQLDEQIFYCLFEFFGTVSELGCPFVNALGKGRPSYLGFGSADSRVSPSHKYEILMDSTSGQLHFMKVLKRVEVYKSWPASHAIKCVQSQKNQLLLLARGGRKVYIETLCVTPIEVIISFSSASWIVNHGGGAQTLLWATGSSVQRGLMALVDIEGAPFQLRQLSLAHPLARWDAIKGMIIRHYTRQLLHEIYKVLGSAGFLGNPMGFIRSLGSGVRDFVAAPARSFVQSPGHLVGGIAQGTQSLVSNIVFAVSNAATLMSRAARKGVTAFALNHEYAAEMERHQQEYDFQDYGVISELLEGLTGLLQSPVTGAERHGIPGILSGVAVGAVGLVARPVASILEVAGRTAQSIRSWSQPIQRQVKRVRPPRYLSRDSPLLPYSWEEAIGNAVLIEAAGSRLKNEVYVTCKPLAESGKYMLLTERLLLKVTSANLATAAGHSSRLGPEWTIDSEIILEDILHIEREGSIINILMGSPRCPSRTKNNSKKMNISTLGPLLHESMKMAQFVDAEELVASLNSLIDEYLKGRPKFVIS